MPSSTKSEITRTERFSLWVGAICGIVGLGFTLWDRATAPTPPKLSAAFALTDSTNLAVAPTAKSPTEAWTDPFPLGLTIQNSGHKTAEDVILRITHPSNFQIHASGIRSRQQLLTGPNGNSVLTTIPIGNIHPEETKHFDDVLFAIVENTMAPTISSTVEDMPTLQATFELVLTYQLDIGLSAKDYSENSSRLLVTIGKAERLRDHVDAFFEVDGQKLIARTNKNDR